MLNISLINPPQIFTKNQVASGVTPPLGIAYLAAYVREEGHSVQIIDALGEAPQKINAFRKNTFLRGLTFDEILEKIRPDADIIGISNLFTFAYPAVEELAKRIKTKFPDKKLILGGPHPSAQFREILRSVPEVDYICVGEEGEESFLRLLMHLEGKLPESDLTGLALRDANGMVVKLASTKRLMELEQGKVPFPARDLLPMENYIKTQESHGSSNGRWTSMLSSRGCPYGCTFCQSRKTRWVSRDAQDVVDEIEYCIKNWGIEEFHFEDDNMTVNQSRLYEICDEINKRGLKIKWQTPNGIRASRTNIEMFEKMKASGCCHITLAPETGSQRVIDEIIQKGRDFSFEHLKACGRDAHKIGLRVAAYFILGLPGETKEDIQHTIKYAQELAKVGVDEVAFGLFIPLPGTPLWDKCGDKVKNLDFLDLLAIGDLSKAISFNDHITPDDLQKLRRKAYLTFFITKALYHPLVTLRSFWNVLRDIEETKSERVLKTLLRRYRFRKKDRKIALNPAFQGAGGDISTAGTTQDMNAYPYDASRTLKVLFQNSPHYSYGHSLYKAVRLIKQDLGERVGKALTFFQKP